MSVPKFTTLDLRPIFARGDEPCDLIRTTVDALTPGLGVTLIAPFAPTRLIESRRSAGYLTTMERRQDGAWAVKLWRE